MAKREASSRTVARSAERLRRPQRRQPREGRQHQIGGDRVDEMQALALAVGRHIGEAERIGPGHAGRQRRGAVDRCRLGFRRNRAVEAEQQILLALADQPADPQHFAGADVEIDVACQAGRESLDRNDGAGRRRRLPAREQVAGIAADHQAHEPGRIGSGERPVGGDAAVLQHRHMLAERHHLVQPVRDIEDRDAFSPSAARAGRSGSPSRLPTATRSARRGSARAACDRAPWRSRPSAAGRAAALRPASTAVRRDRRARRRPLPARPAPGSRSCRTGADSRRARCSRRSTGWR